MVKVVQSYGGSASVACSATIIARSLDATQYFNHTGPRLRTPALLPCFTNQVERRFCRAAEARKTRLPEDLPQSRLSGLGTQPEADLLGQRIRRTNERRGRVK